METKLIFCLVCGLTSFVMVALSLLIDFFDREHGNAYRKGIYLFGMLYNAAMLIRFKACDAGQFYWLAITILQFVEKWAQFKGKEKLIDSKLSVLRRVMKQSHTY